MKFIIYHKENGNPHILRRCDFNEFDTVDEARAYIRNKCLHGESRLEDFKIMVDYPVEGESKHEN